MWNQQLDALCKKLTFCLRVKLYNNLNPQGSYREAANKFGILTMMYITLQLFFYITNLSDVEKLQKILIAYINGTKTIR